MSDPKPIKGTFQETLARLQAKVAEIKEKKSEAIDPTPQTKPLDEQTMLPAWPEDKRALPHSFIRSSLFGILKKGSRAYLKKAEITSVAGLDIKYTGEQLDQADQDVWLAVLEKMHDLPLGSFVEISSYELLKVMGLSDGYANYEALDSSITRMVASAVRIETDKQIYIGSLLHYGHKQKETQMWKIQLNPELIELFKDDLFTHIDFKTRQDLKGQLAKWLHSFYSSHARAYPFKIETLKELCGSQTKELWKFKQQLIKALDEVVEISKKHHQIIKYEIKNGLVHFEKSLAPEKNLKNLINNLNQK